MTEITEPKPNPSNAIISYLTAFLVFALAAGAFALSYDALRNVAAENGVTGWRSTVWPLLVDAALVIFSLAVARNTLNGERTRWPWFLVALYTVATIAFNILHVPGNVFRIPDTITRQIVAAVAPVSLFLAFETLMAMLIASVRRNNAILSLEQLSAQTESMQTESERIATQLTETRRRHETLTRETAALAVQLEDRKAQYETLTRESEILSARLEERKRRSQPKAKSESETPVQAKPKAKQQTESETESQPAPKPEPPASDIGLPNWLPYLPSRQDFIAMVKRGDINLPEAITGRELAAIIGSSPRTGELWLAAARNGHGHSNGN